MEENNVSISLYTIEIFLYRYKLFPFVLLFFSSEKKISWQIYFQEQQVGIYPLARMLWYGLSFSILDKEFKCCLSSYMLAHSTYCVHCKGEARNSELLSLECVFVWMAEQLFSGLSFVK